MYRTVLVHVHADTGSSERTKLAIEVARQFGASLIGLTAGLPRLPVEVYAAGVSVVAAGYDFTELDRQELEAEFKTGATRFAELTKGTGIATDWRALIGFPANAIVDAASAADLVVMGAGDRTMFGGYRSASPGDVFLHTGRPILLVPEGCETLKAERVLIAWKATRESRRAVADALPFLKRAAHVDVVTIAEGDRNGDASLADVAAFLFRHGVAATTETLADTGGFPADQLLNHARRLNAGLVVAGGYGHSRLRELVFGGMTRGLLAGFPVPCLISH